MGLTPEIKAKLTSADHALLGAIAGTVEVTTLQPIIFVKYAVQEGRALPRNPLHYYRGFACNVGTFAPITATQFGASRLTESLIRKYMQRDITQIDTIGCAAIGGAASAILSSPSELVQIQQQRTGQGMSQAVQSVVRTHGALTLYRGMAPMLVRESVYTAAYLGLVPVLRARLDASGAMEGQPESASLLVSGITAGMLGSFFSHPADTIKTRMQAFLEVDKTPEYRNVASTTSKILSEGGVAKLYAGFGSRCVRQVIATLLVNFTKEILGPHVAAMKSD